MSDAKRIFEGKHVYLLEREGWEFVERKNAAEAVAVIARTDEGSLILTEQYRRPVDARVIDWPAGLVGDEGGSRGPEEAAKKELEEETGYGCSRVELLARGPSSPGITSEIVSFYRAHDVKKIGAGGGVEGEKITVHLVAEADLRQWLSAHEKSGGLVDLKIWGGLQLLDGKRS